MSCFAVRGRTFVLPEIAHVVGRVGILPRLRFFDELVPARLGLLEPRGAPPHTLLVVPQRLVIHLHDVRPKALDRQA